MRVTPPLGLLLKNARTATQGSDASPSVKALRQPWPSVPL